MLDFATVCLAFEVYGLSALRKVLIIIAIAIAFLFGLTGTVYLSLRVREVRVPDIVGKEYSAGESALESAGLHIRKRGTRPSTERPPNTILDQVPHAGEVVKVGQTVAVDVTRSPNEGESGVAAPAENANGRTTGETSGTTPAPINENENQNKPRKPRNTNTNANVNSNIGSGKNANNVNAGNANSGGKGNANERNANVHNANSTRNANANRTGGNQNSNRRVPQISTPPFNPGAGNRIP